MRRAWASYCPYRVGGGALRNTIKIQILYSEKKRILFFKAYLSFTSKIILVRQLDLELIEKVKRLAVLAMVSDDNLMETLIFKGGSAIDMIYDASGRGSLDLDYSMAKGLSKEEEEVTSKRIKETLVNTFEEEGFLVHGIKFEKRPDSLPEEITDFWGGYQVIFKVIPLKLAEDLDQDKSAIIRRSLALGRKGSTKFKIDISSHEYVDTKNTSDFEGYTINVYSPEMIAFEKLRAICQQLPNYKSVVKSFKARARGRDFYDIELLMTGYNINPTTTEHKELIKNIFAIKRVPLDYIKEIRNHREFHRENFNASLKETVSVSQDLKNFDYYFDYVLDKFENIDLS